MKKILFLAFFLFAFAFCFSSQAGAVYVPKIYIPALEVGDISNNQINGNLTVWNADDFNFPDLNYVIKLFEGTQFENLELIDTLVPNEAFSIAPKGTVVKSFTYNYPKNIAGGDYTIRAQVITAKGSELGWKDQVVSLKGESKFLNVLYDFSKVVSGGKEARPLTGLNVSPEEEVVVFLKIKNPGSAVTAVPHIKIFQRQYNMSLVKEYQDSPITFSKNETKSISLKMPKLSMPESYLAEVKFYQGTEQVSGIQYFRWVVEGEGAKILYIRTDKDSYSAGENMKIIVDYVGSADWSTVKGAKLGVVVYDQNKNIVAEASKDIDLNFNLLSSTITIPVKSDLVNPKVEASITKNSQALDNYGIMLQTPPEKIKQLEGSRKFKNLLIYSMLALVLAIILIAGFLLYKFKFHKFR